MTLAAPALVPDSPVAAGLPPSARATRRRPGCQRFAEASRGRRPPRDLIEDHRHESRQGTWRPAGPRRQAAARSTLMETRPDRWSAARGGLRRGPSMLGIAGALSAAEVGVTMHRGAGIESLPDRAPSLPTERHWSARRCSRPRTAGRRTTAPRPPAMTEFRRRTRYHQAQWREARGLPDRHPADAARSPTARRRGSSAAGSRSTSPRRRARRSSRPTALAAARRRTSTVERHQSLDRQRLWADLLSSEALAINLFGDLAADHALADRAVHAWWPDAPGTVADVRFEHSPGRLDPAYLNSLRRFDAAFVLDARRRDAAGSSPSTSTTTSAARPRPRSRPTCGATWRSPRDRARSAPGAVDAGPGPVACCA